MQRLPKQVNTKSRRFCSVPQCSSYCTENISLHYFPKTEKLKAVWKNTLKIGKPISTFMSVCSEHFIKSDFLPITDHTIRKRLKKNAIPSQKLPKICSYPSHYDKSSKIERSKRIRQEDALEKEVSTTTNSEVQSDVIMEEELVYNIPQPDVMEEKQLENCSLDVSKMPKTFVDQATQTDEFFIFSELLSSDEKLSAFTGINNNILNAYERCLKNVANYNNIIDNGNLKVMLILVMTKLKVNLSFVCLSILFNMGQKKCSDLFAKFTSLLSIAVRPAIYWPTKSEISANMPICFKDFKNTRIVLDCTEVKVQKLSCLKCRIKSYSHYKGCHTMKYLIGIAPSGMITYISKGYGGRASDKSIVLKENLIQKLDPYDAVMVDKGVLIEKECNENLIKLIQPPFLKKKKQFTKDESLKTAAIARARVHVERAIQRMKIFNILNDTIDWNLIPHMDNIFTIIAATVNMSPPILSEDKF